MELTWGSGADEARSEIDVADLTHRLGLTSDGASVVEDDVLDLRWDGWGTSEPRAVRTTFRNTVTLSDGPSDGEGGIPAGRDSDS